MPASNSLTSMDLRAFAEAVMSATPTPGGGSVAALAGALGAGLASMVFGLSIKKASPEDAERFEKLQREAAEVSASLMGLVDQDSRAYDAVVTAFKMPKGTEEEKAARARAIQEAFKEAVEAPLAVMRLSCRAAEWLKVAIEKGNPNAASDAAVGALAIRTAVMGAKFNVAINLGYIKDEDYTARVRAEVSEILTGCEVTVSEVIARFEDTVGKALSGGN